MINKGPRFLRQGLAHGGACRRQPCRLGGNTILQVNPEDNKSKRKRLAHAHRRGAELLAM